MCLRSVGWLCVVRIEKWTEIKGESKMGMRWTLYGYEIVNDTYRIVPAEASNIRKMFKDYISGSTLQVVAAGLTAKEKDPIPIGMGSFCFAYAHLS